MCVQGEVVLRYLVYPGAIADGFYSLDVALPWCGVCFFGIAMGYEFKHNAKRAAQRAGMLGFLFLGCFALVRFFGACSARRGRFCLSVVSVGACLLTC